MIQQSALAQIVERRTYLRPINANGTKFETPEQAWRRVIDHQKWLWERAQGHDLDLVQLAELEELFTLFMERKVTVSGRTRWLGGTEIAKTRESSQFNCAFGEIQTVHDVVDSIWLLLQGCGVGFSANIGVLNGFTQRIDEIEIIRSSKVLKRDAAGNPISDPALKGRPDNVESFNKNTGVWTIKVGDSAEAWAKLFGKILAFKGRATKLIIDLSEIRPEGYRLSGYGWISSGDGQLSMAIEGILEVMNNAEGRLLTAIDILDIVNWLGTILSSRRSAEIALYPHGEPEWEVFALAKKDHNENGLWHRSMSNNSLLFYHKPTKPELKKIFGMIERGGGSEPGFINAIAALRRATYFKGVNPCVVYDTLVSTVGGGLRRVGSLTDAVIVDGNGNNQSVVFQKTGTAQPVLTVCLSDGTEVEATPTHRFVTNTGEFVEAQNLEPGTVLKVSDIENRFGVIHNPEDAYRDAWLIADGTWYNNKGSSKILLYGNKQKYADAFGRKSMAEPDYNRIVVNFSGVPYLDKSRVPDYVLSGDRETVESFVRGYMESDGHIGHTSKGWTAQITSVHKEFLIEFYQLIRLLGVRGHIAKSREAGAREMPDGNGGTKYYECKDVYRLTISNPIKLLEWLRPEVVKRRAYITKDKNISVVHVTDCGNVADVYCTGVDSTQSFDLGTVHSGNCAEILLGDKSFCNLVEVAVSRFNGDMNGLIRAMWIIARANYRQTCVNLDDGVLQRTWHELNEFLRLCGVGLAGIIGWEHHNKPEFLQKIRKAAQDGANGMADELGTPRPQLVTTVKPGGTQAKVFGCIGDEVASGAHMPLGRYLFIRVIVPLNDPLLKACENAGYRIEPVPNNAESRIVVIPAEYNNIEFDKVTVNGVEVEVNQESAIDQLDRYKMLQENYVDHNCSITIYYDKGEVQSIIDWLSHNWDSYVGVSFLYRPDPVAMVKDPDAVAKQLGYLYLPQTPVASGEYHDYVKTLSPVDFTGTEHEEIIDADFECAGGSCPIR